MLVAIALASRAQAETLEGSGVFVPDFAQIATYVFVMLGPVKVLVPFAGMTRGMEVSELSKLAFFGVLLSLVTLAVAATLGVSMLHSWAVSTGALEMGLGIIVFLVALEPILRQFVPGPPAAPAAPAAIDGATPSAPPTHKSALSRLVFPTIVAPQGVALVILVIAAYPNLAMDMALAVVAIMAINLVAMVMARQILKMPGIGLALIVFANVLGVLQVALGIQLVIAALRLLHIIAPAG